jgi:hypothetical protein
MKTGALDALQVPVCAILSGLLFLAFSLARERLVPRHADRERAAWRLSGDEPHYLLTAQALAAGDGEDFRHVNARKTYTNFQQRAVTGGDYSTWGHYQRRGVPHILDRSAAWGDKKVVHRPPLIALFCAPFVFMPDRVRWTILLAQGIWVSVLAGLALLLFRFEDTRRVMPGAVAVFCGLASMPVAYYTAQIYPEVLVGSLLFLSVGLTRRPERHWQWLGYLCMILCLWGSARVLAGVLAVSLVYGLRSIRRRDGAGLAVLAIGLGSYLAYNLWLWGYFLPPNPDPSSQCSLSALPRGVLANFFGNDVGMFWLSPVTWVGFVCMILALVYQRRDRGTWPTALLWAGTVISVGSFPNIRAGTCPAGRYQVLQCFLSVLAILIVLRDRGGIPGKWRARVVAALGVLGLLSVAMAVLVLIEPRSWYEAFHPLFRYKPLAAFYGWLPDFHGSGWGVRLIGWLGVFGVTVFIPDIVAYGRRRLQGGHHER